MNLLKPSGTTPGGFFYIHGKPFGAVLISILKKPVGMSAAILRSQFRIFSVEGHQTFLTERGKEVRLLSGYRPIIPNGMSFSIKTHAISIVRNKPLVKRPQ